MTAAAVSTRAVLPRRPDHHRVLDVVSFACAVRVRWTKWRGDRPAALSITYDAGDVWAARTRRFSRSSSVATSRWTTSW